MSERSEYAPGEFCWVDLAVPDVEAAGGFYGDLLGWEPERYEPDPEGYWYLRQRGSLVAGLEGIRMEGQVPAWLGYVRVEDAGATAGKVTDAGGEVLAGPIDVPGGAGRLAVCRDPEGAIFGLWQPRELTGAELVNEPGSWTWNNLMTRDPDAAQAFYSRVFGWTATQPDGAPDYIWNWQLEGQRWPEGLGGLFEIRPEMPADMPAHWQVYLAVPSADKTIVQALSSGSKLGFGPIDTPVARMATLVDPQGAVVSILEPRYPESR